ncbi:MAG: carboxyl-terminal processing protease [Candidatus Pseudothioglobus sp.]|jgi:carboxyl-terminal processing protease
MRMMQHPLRILAGTCLALILGSASANDASDSTDKALAPRLPLNELRVFAEAFDRVSSAYVEEIDDRTLLENAIKGMLSQLDPHSAYLDRESFSDLQEETSGNYGGVGLEVSMEDGFVRVISPMDGTPADKAGVMAGDLIIQLDDQPMRGLSLSAAIDTMRGAPGSIIRLTVVREGEAQPFELSLTREVIAVASVRQRMLDDGFGYIRIAQFQSNTGEEVAKAVTKLTEDGKLSGLVLDLRNNPGGVLQAAVAVSDVFMDSGLIVYTAGRLPNSDMRFNASTPDATDGTPIVVLVNEGTASASEIVAGALQDHSRAIIMGVDTFGKGSVQTILPLNNEKAIKLTTALYFTPNGRSIQAEGIVPDILVPRASITPDKQNPFRVRERNLPKHLANGNSKPMTAEESLEKAAKEIKQITDEENTEEPLETAMEEPSVVTDYQLHEALNLLKGLNILAKKASQTQG